MAEFSGGVLRLNEHKAGLSQLQDGGKSKEEISKILTAASEGSPFYTNKKLKHQVIEQRIAVKKSWLTRRRPRNGRMRWLRCGLLCWFSS